TKKSFIIFSTPIIWTMLTFFFLMRTDPFLAGFSGLPLINSLAHLAWLPGLIAIFYWLNQSLVYLTSDFIITDQRVIMREGFFSRHSTETRLAAIAEIKVDQSLLGRLMNFGSIRINSFGGGAEVFADINAPYDFQRKVSEKIG
ncbi:MAG TPA: PH domain-containing protein, partial [Gammaproteobacteria bacterium]|nr:PH domain-containing protein [Gammaproteobacteria bacterium]